MIRKLLPLIVLLIAGCVDSDSDSIDNDRIYNENYTSWMNSDANAYVFNYEESGFTPLRGAWEIQVNQSEVIHVVYLGTDNPQVVMSVETAPTINKLYSQVESCIESQSCIISQLGIDEEAHVPTTFSYSQGEEGFGFKITEFRLL